jgi:hypothetical protein
VAKVPSVDQLKVKWSREVIVDVPPGVVTMTSACPTLPDGVIAVIVVSLVTVTAVACAPPTVTEVAPVKYWPKIVMGVPPE